MRTNRKGHGRLVEPGPDDETSVCLSHVSKPLPHLTCENSLRSHPSVLRVSQCARSTTTSTAARSSAASRPRSAGAWVSARRGRAAVSDVRPCSRSTSARRPRRYPSSTRASGTRSSSSGPYSGAREASRPASTGCARTRGRRSRHGPTPRGSPTRPCRPASLSSSSFRASGARAPAASASGGRSATCTASRPCPPP